MTDLYNTDILTWSEQQASLLRQAAAGQRLNAPLDWENVIEEIESVGREQLHAVESLIVQALLHMSKITAWPKSPAVPGCQAEVQLACDAAASRFVPSMNQRLDIEKLYRRALRGLPKTIDGQPPLPLPTTCPHTLAALLSDDESMSND